MGLSLAALALIASPMMASANGPEPLLLRALRKPGGSLPDGWVSPLDVHLHKPSQIPGPCPAHAYVKYLYFRGTGVPPVEIPLRITLSRSAQPPSPEKILTGLRVVADPVRPEASIEIRLEEGTQEEYSVFLQKLSAGLREEVERGIHLGRESSLEIDVKHPDASGTCLQVHVSNRLPRKK